MEECVPKETEAEPFPTLARQPTVCAAVLPHEPSASLPKWANCSEDTRDGTGIFRKNIEPAKHIFRLQSLVAKMQKFDQ
jgi:hypothetical protein